MKRNVLVIVVAAAVVAAVVGARRCGGAGAASSPSSSAAARAAGDRPAGARARPRVDPHTLARGRITGHVRDPAGAPLAGTVCASWSGPDLSAEETREPRCATADASGAYALGDLVPATYTLAASAPGHVPAAWRGPDRDDELRLAAGETRTGVDLVLDGGAVEVHGVVSDINGGPIARALVTTTTGDWWSPRSGGAVTHSKDDGTFALWARPGTITVQATADGYSPGEKTAAAPGARVEVLLTPEAVLAGTVVQAGTHAPVAGAMVYANGFNPYGGVGGGSARTDARGRFRITRLPPGRYKPTASGDGYYGEPAQSVLLALGQSVEDVVIEVHPAANVEGKVVIAGAAGAETPCARGGVWMHDPAHDLTVTGDTAADGTVTIRGVLPGTYAVTAYCKDELGEDHYPPLTVAGADVTGRVWKVHGGGAIVGRVHDHAGKPIADVLVRASVTGGDPRGQRSWGWETTARDGTFACRGLTAGTYDVRVDPDDRPEPKDPVQVTVPARGDVTADITLDDGGTVHGTVVDETGRAVPDAEVQISGARWGGAGGARTADDGTFTVRGVAPGPVRVAAYRSGWDELRAPGTHDDDTQGVKVTVADGRTVEVKLVVESQSGTIAGEVVDATGAPVPDAYLSAQRESDAAGTAAGAALRRSRWTWDRLPVVTGTDGTFTLTALAPGSYTVRAYRKGGGEAALEHVAVGGHAHVVMKPAGRLGGTVAIGGGGAPALFAIEVGDRATGFSRTESFYETGGAFAMRDLPAGHFTVTASAAEGHTTADVALGDGEARDDVRLTLERLVRVTGRIVDVQTGQPVSDLMVMVVAAKGAGGFTFDLDGSDPDRKFITDAGGRFEVARAPIGRDLVQAIAMDWERSPWGWVRKLIVVAAGQDTVDVGDVEIARRRVGARDRGGDLGMSYADQDPNAEPDAYVLRVAHVDAGGPAAAGGVAVGDVIASVDGIDVRGARWYLAGTLLEVPAGTTVHLGLTRGTGPATAAVTAGPPK